MAPASVEAPGINLYTYEDEKRDAVRERAAVVLPAYGTVIKRTPTPTYVYAVSPEVLLRKTLLLAILGGVTYGYGSANIAGASVLIAHQFGLGHWRLGILVASALVGMAVGSPKGGAIADRFGRRMTVLAAGALAALGAAGSALAWDFWSIIAFRLLGGVGAGIAITSIPLYVSEVAEAEARGRMGTVFQIGICVGTLAAYVSAYAFNASGEPEGDSWRWRGIFALGAAPGLALVLLVRHLPESARWLAHRAQGLNGDSTLAREPGALAGPEQEGRPASRRSVSTKTGLAALFEREQWGPLALAMVITFAKKCTGINVIIYYAPALFRRSGFGASSLIPTMCMGVWNLLTALASIRLIDSVGRRPLLIGGLAVVGAADLLLGLAFGVPAFRPALGPLAVIAVSLFIAAFEIGVGPLFYVAITELFPQRCRGAALSLSGFLLCLYQIVTSAAFPAASAAVGDAAVFIAFGVVGLLSSLYIARRMPETAGRQLEEIEDSFLEASLDAE
eukprot:tig00021612_g22865.t1